MSRIYVTSDNGRHAVEIVEVDDGEAHYAGACPCGWQTRTDRRQTLDDAVAEAELHVDRG